MYIPPTIHSGHGAARSLRDLTGNVLVVTMEIPWAAFQKLHPWHPGHVHFVTDMDKETVENLDATLPPCDIVVGIGGGSSVDTAKYLAWKRGCPMVLVPSIISVDAPLTNTVAVRVDKTVQYIADIYPQELIVDYDLIHTAPPELNRAGACDIASIHTGLYDWELAHQNNGEAYNAAIARQARECLLELDRHAEDVYNVTPKGIDTVIDLFRREVEFCAEFGNSRPEEGSEHLVAYNIEHIARRHFVHGDLVGFGIFTMSRLQDNEADWAEDLLKRVGLRFGVPDASREELAEALYTLLAFKEKTGLFYSIVDERTITEAFVRDCLAGLRR